MSCSNPPKLLSYYSNKVNIYDNSNFILLPTWRSCPPPPCIYIAPQVIYPSTEPWKPCSVQPMSIPINPPGTYCGSIIAPPCNPCNTNQSINYGTTIPCEPCASQAPTTGCSSCK